MYASVRTNIVCRRSLVFVHLLFAFKLYSCSAAHSRKSFATVNFRDYVTIEALLEKCTRQTFIMSLWWDISANDIIKNLRILKQFRHIWACNFYILYYTYKICVGIDLFLFFNELKTDDKFSGHVISTFSIIWFKSFYISERLKTDS